MSLLTLRFNLAKSLKKLLKTGFNNLLNGLLVWTVLSAIALPLQLDRWPTAVFLTYIPRPLYIALGFILACGFLLQKRYLKLSICAFAIALCLHSLGWGNGAITKPLSSSATSLTLLSMNVHEHPEKLQGVITQLTLPPDILCLQEVSQSVSRGDAQTAFPDYEFYWGDKNLETAPPDGAAFTSVIGLRRSRFETAQVAIAPAITGYRTFAVTTQLKPQQISSIDGQDLDLSQQLKEVAIVNVHTTKALVFHAGIQGFITQTPAKAIRHIHERQQLETWAAAQTVPVIAAGDFNAPSGSVGARLTGFHSSHKQAGNGPLLTFPTRLPLIGIDHIQGNARIQFHRSLVLDKDFSDHLPQIAYFSLKPSTE